MVAQLFSIKTVLITLLVAKIDCTLWSCSKNGKAMPIITSQMAGAWHEIVRAPSSEVPACVEVLVPESQLNGSYTLELNYVNNVNRGWKPIKESLVFPWTEARKGNFNLIYSNGVMNLSVNFKYLGSIRGFALVCGYMDLAARLSIIRILSRNKTLNNSVKAELDTLIRNFTAAPDLTWVEQGERCNGSEKFSKYVGGFWIFLFIFHTIVYVFCF